MMDDDEFDLLKKNIMEMYEKLTPSQQMLLYIINNSQKEALKETLNDVKRASEDENSEKNISPHVMALRNRPPRNKRKGRTYLS